MILLSRHSEGSGRDRSPLSARSVLQPQTSLEKRVFLQEADRERRTRAVRLYRAIVDLPIVDLHTHYDTGQIVENRPWQNPTRLFLGLPGQGFDHYLGSLMLAKGVAPKLVFGRDRITDLHPSEDLDFERWQAIAMTTGTARGNPTSVWINGALEEVFGIAKPLCRENAGEVWQELSRHLATDDFRPQSVLTRFGVKAALTTDDPADDLSLHARHQGADPATFLLPTFRPDAALIIEDSRRVDFMKWAKRVGQAAGMSVESLGNFEIALTRRMEHFRSHSCVAADIGFTNFYDQPCTRDEAKAIFAKRVIGVSLSPLEIAQWKTYMLRFLAVEHAKQGWVQYWHQGPARDLNSGLFQAHGADVGGDAQGEQLNRAAFAAFLDHLQVRAPDARAVIFPINPSDYNVALSTINRFQGNEKGIRSRYQLGAAWWTEDTIDGNAGVIRLTEEKAVLEDSLGMLSDARCLPSVVARFRMYRAILALELLRLRPDESDEQLRELATRVCYTNARDFLNLGARLRD